MKQRRLALFQRLVKLFSRRTAVVAATTALLGIAIGIFAASPSQWHQSLTEWLTILRTIFDVIWPALLTLASLLFGLMLGRYVLPDTSGLAGNQPNVMFEAEFSNLLQLTIAQHVVRKMDILSYTNETVGDLLKYEYRNKEGLQLRVLSRSWLDERADEQAYNARLAGSKTRRWHKADMIERIARTPWHNVCSREQRFYWGMHPFLKVIIVEAEHCQLAFVSIYDWQEWPADGGAPFKGANPVGILLDSRLPKDAIILRSLHDQFRFLWDYQSYAVDDVRDSPYRSVFARASSDDTSPDGDVPTEVED